MSSASCSNRKARSGVAVCAAGDVAPASRVQGEEMVEGVLHLLRGERRTGRDQVPHGGLLDRWTRRPRFSGWRRRIRRTSTVAG